MIRGRPVRLALAAGLSVTWGIVFFAAGLWWPFDTAIEHGAPELVVAMMPLGVAVAVAGAVMGATGWRAWKEQGEARWGILSIHLVVGFLLLAWEGGPAWAGPLGLWTWIVAGLVALPMRRGANA